jgi:two-component system alkaline phosphatase synthesis response regulator PhoP
MDRFVQISKMDNILIVDDDPDIIEFVRYNLEKEDFNVEMASSGYEALKKVKTFNPALILLDVMLPDIDGVETCMKIRENKEGHQPIIAFLTARSEDYSHIAGLEAGGDDYISKPIKPRLLVSRVKALLRRKNDFQANEQTLQIGNLSLDRAKHLVIIDGKEIHLPRKQFNMLSLLISNAGNVVRRTSLMQKIWGDEVYVSERNIDVQIRKIREKIGQDLIKTVKGVGYKFKA